MGTIVFFVGLALKFGEPVLFGGQGFVGGILLYIGALLLIFGK